MKSKSLKRVISFALASAVALAMTACGGAETGENGSQDNHSAGGLETKEFVYVPEFIELEDENISYYDMQYAGDSLYFESYSWDETTGESSQSIVRYSLTDGSTSKVSIALGEAQSINRFAVAADGSIYTVLYDYSDQTPGPEGYPESKQLLCKYDAEGTALFSQDLAKLLKENTENNYVQGITIDSEGRIYVSGSTIIWLFDAEGNHQGSVETGDNWINSTGCGRDGKVYFSYYNNGSENSGYVLSEIDFEQKAVGATYENFSSGSGSSLYAGRECDFLTGDGSSVYEYDLATQERSRLFDWLDSDINGSYATCMGQLEDGRFLAVVNDWENNDSGIVLLTKTKASETAQKETIVIAAMSSGSELQAAAVRFNKSSDKYHISIKTYLDYNNWNDNSWSDALTNLNNDITSNNCPDIIDLSNVNVEKLAAKGVFEDLTPYLEGSSQFDRDDFIDSVMEAYTYNGILVSIPANFELQTVVGRASEVGDEMGWTIDEMIAYADAHPNAQLFNYSDKESILRLCMRFNESAFIDWNTGECKFDTPEFKSLLEFVNRFPDEFQYEEGGASTPTRIQNGEILLETAYIYDFEELQLYNEMFSGDVSCIGYPTTDGSSGTALMANQAYAITSKSKVKDGAWEFIESFLSRDEENSNMYRWSFPNNKEQLAAMAEEAVKVEYLTDENGEILKDENGEAIIQGAGSGVGYEDGWFYEYRIPTQEEVDQVMELIEAARPVAADNDEVLSIINEEAAAYFKGQKSVDDVVNIIQSRINIYVSENS